jgi:DNA-binding transcriptional ArsR family regulator
MQMDHLSTTFAALSDPTRRAILSRLATGQATVKELARPFSISGPAISRHLRVLEQAGLIARGRDAQWRPCTLKGERLREVAEYANEFRQVWEQNFSRLDDYVKTMMPK